MPKYNKPKFATSYSPGNVTISNATYVRLIRLARAAYFLLENEDFLAILTNLWSQYEADALSPEGNAAAKAILLNADTLEYRVNELYGVDELFGKDPK